MTDRQNSPVYAIQTMAVLGPATATPSTPTG